MVFFLTSPIGVGHIEGLIQRFDKSQSRHLFEMTYADLVRRGRAPRGAAYVFADRQRMSPPFHRMAIELWRQLEEAGGVRLYSNPSRCLTRFGLLSRLYEEGQNEFRAHWLSDLEGREPTFPVFVRLEDDHSGPKTDLIFEMKGLRREVDRLLLGGANPERLLVVEFLDTSDETGRFHKYGAIRIGDRIHCQHIFRGDSWNVKADSRTRSDAIVEESDAIFLTNPHAERLRPLFELSGIEYGRADYSLHQDRIQVWEINDNPVIAGGPWRREAPRALSRLNKGPTWFEAMRTLEEGTVEGPPIDLDTERLIRAMHQDDGAEL